MIGSDNSYISSCADNDSASLLKSHSYVFSFLNVEARLQDKRLDLKIKLLLPFLLIYP